MRPKNDFQRQVVAAMRKLRPATKRQMQWGYDNSVYFYAYRLKSGKTTCMECGHTFVTEEGTEEVVCPHCGKHLTIEETKKEKLSQVGYFSIITTADGLQVLRYFFIRTHQRKGEKTTYTCTEVMQRWIDKDGNTCTTSRLRAPYSYCIDDWLCGSSLEIRTHSTAFPIVDGCSIYPQFDTIPELKRNGFDGNFHNTLPSALFESLLTNAKTETLVKAGYHELARKFIYDQYWDIDLYWASVKVCIRNHYAIDDASVWCDYIDALRYFGKDLHNAKYVCPTDLNAEHDRWIEKKERKEIEKSINDKIEQFQKDEEKFRKLKSRYFGIHFTDGLICVHVLESVEEYLQEGEHMHHCVYSNKYYLKKNSLILSATINGKRVETIEVSLKTMKVLQCYGACNKFTEHHARIIDLVNKNAYLIGQRVKAA